MPTIDPTTTTTAASSASAASRTSSSALGKDDFLKLLVGQLQHQDPSNPSGDTDFIGQMAQFSMLEQLANLADATHTLTDQTTTTQTLGLLGRTVTYIGSDGMPVTGTVDSVDLVGGTPTLTVAGVAGVSPSSVAQVR
jgi:flagellar basal-body rod modification protein FlgD